jgi:uncharacterized membrane protein
MAAEGGTERGMDRLIFFTDAVAAIAITLLILPLVDRVSDSKTVDLFLHDNAGQIGAFALSFVVIARFWMGNHQLLKHAERTTPVLMWLNIAWAFTVVVLPLPTEITAAFTTSSTVLALYIGTVAASSLLLTAMGWYLHRHPELMEKGYTESLTQVWGTGITSAMTLIALLLSLTIPHVSFYSLALLLLTGPLDRIVKPRIRRYEASRTLAAGHTTTGR